MTALFPAKTISQFWCLAKDGDAEARRVFHRHYSYRRYKDGRRPKLFFGPGFKVLLITPEADAIFGWKKFDDASGQVGINCCFFRNESPHKSSDMIRDADEIAFEKWPGERHYTYVNPKKIRSTNPGYCFIQAGWRKCGVTKNGLIILEKLT